MRYKADHKEKTRLKMVNAAGRSFRQHGYFGIGVDGLAKAAGVTSGAFYSHFDSKDDAFDAALVEGLDEVISAIPNFQKEHGANWVREFCDYYLSKAHRKDLACGCAMASLTTEVVRSGPTVRTVFEKKMNQIVSLMMRGLSGRTDDELRNRVWAMLGILIGGINVARAMKSQKMSNEVATAITDAAIKAAGRTKKAA